MILILIVLLPGTVILHQTTMTFVVMKNVPHQLVVYTVLGVYEYRHLTLSNGIHASKRITDVLRSSILRVLFMFHAHMIIC